MVGLLAGGSAVVTGGAQGIGYAIAQAFVEQGARVVIGDIDKAAADSAAAALGADNAIAQQCDVADAAQTNELLDIATRHHGTPSIMVNNAGIVRDAMMHRMTEAQFDEVIAVHLRGCWNGTRAAVAHMRPAKRGSIVNISALSGKVGLVGQTNYSAAKAGIVGMSKAAAKELGSHGVRVNAIQPGLIRTAMTKALPEAIWEQKMAEIPLGRAGEPEEVARVAVFLASDLASYLTGNVIEVAGGRFM